MNGNWKASGSDVVLMALSAVLILSADAGAQENPPYMTYGSFAELMVGENAEYPKLVRVSEPGTRENPNYTGFFFYQCLQFDPTDCYVLGVRVHCQNRDVKPTDRAEIGFIHLEDGYKWTQIGETTAWNWQQGARLQWRPGSEEILWNDRSDDSTHYVCRVYNFKTGARRTLPRPVYTPSPDGTAALTHDFERMKHGGTPYVGIRDRCEGQYAPKETGIWRMDLNTGDAVLIMSLDTMAEIAYPKGPPSSGCLYVFREGWNPSGSRFIAFIKDPDNKFDKAFSMTGIGTDVRYLYNLPSHHEWRDDDHILDGRGYYLYDDDGTGKAKGRLFESNQNSHVNYVPGPGGDWILSDTYAIDGYQYLFMYHVPTKRFVPLAKLKSTAPTNVYRVDLHPRLSRDRRVVSIDATHEGLGRQMYVLDIGRILDNPPGSGPKERPRSSDSKADGVSPAKKTPEATPLSPRTERFTRIETLAVGEFSVDLCRREDGAFGLGEIRRGTLPLRRADVLVTWQVEGKLPVFERRDGLTVHLRQPDATLTFTSQRRQCAGTSFTGFRMELKATRGPIVETASWELGGSTKGLSYFDGYRGWHAPPQWLHADAVPETNPKLLPSLLQGTGFQFQHGEAGALLHFHTTPGDRLRNASRGESLEFVTTFDGPASVTRYIFTAEGDSRIDLWSRAFEVAHAELRRTFDLSEPTREILLHWPPFSRKGFDETARQCVAATAGDGFTGASIDVIWDNADFHGGAKNMNVWDLSVCKGYGGEAGLKSLVDECHRNNLRVIFWAPAGHLWDRAQLWNDHPDWLLRRGDGQLAKTPTGPVFGNLDSEFRDYYRDSITRVIRQFGFDGVWLDTHLSYSQQTDPPDHAARLAEIYRVLIEAGARHLLVEGDASAFGSYSIAIGDDWEKAWDKMPEPDLYYGAMLMAGSMEPQFYLRHFRRWTAAGAFWAIDWDFLHSTKLKGEQIETARREVRQVVQDYRRVKDRMVHRFVHADGSGYTWTNDRDTTRVVWLLQDAPLPDGRRGQAGQVYVIR